MTTTPTSGAADLPEALHRSTAADGKTELFNLPGYPLMVRAVDFNRLHTESEMRRAALLDEMQKAALAAGQATAAQPGVVYAALPEYGINTASHAHFRVLGFTADQMRAFADATHMLRASHGQAPAGATELAEADRRAGAAERKLAASKEDVARIERVRDKMKDQWGVDRRVSFDVVWAEALALKAGTKSDSGVQEDAALWHWLEQHDGRYYNLDKVAAIVGTGFLVQSEGNMPQVHSTLREAVYAARKQGATK